MQKRIRQFMVTLEGVNLNLERIQKNQDLLQIKIDSLLSNPTPNASASSKRPPSTPRDDNGKRSISDVDTDQSDNELTLQHITTQQSQAASAISDLRATLSALSSQFATYFNNNKSDNRGALGGASTFASSGNDDDVMNDDSDEQL